MLDGKDIIHCENSQGSFDECRLQNSVGRPPPTLGLKLNNTQPKGDTYLTVPRMTEDRVDLGDRYIPRGFNWPHATANQVLTGPNKEQQCWFNWDQDVM